MVTGWSGAKLQGPFEAAWRVNFNSDCCLLFVFSDVTFAAKGYFDALVRMGELASESQGSKDLGKCFR